MDVVISVLNSITFKQVNNDLSNFDNTLYCDEIDGELLPQYYAQKFVQGDDIIIQLQVKNEDPVDYKLYRVYNDITTEETSKTTTVYSSAYNTVDFTVDLDLIGISYYYVTIDDTTYWISEPIEVVESITGLHKIEATNTETAYLYDFETDTSIIRYVESEMVDYILGGESDIFKGFQEIMQLRDSKRRGFRFKTGFIPRYHAEALAILFGLDYVLIDDKEYVLEEPEISEGKETVLTINAIDKNILGYNMSDYGVSYPAVLTTLVPGDGTTSWDNVSAGLIATEGELAWESGTGWDKQANFSESPETANFELSFRFLGSEYIGYGIYGLNDDPATSTGYTDINFSFKASAGDLKILENGSTKYTAASFNVLDILTIKRVGGVIKYYQNDNLLYTSLNSSTVRMYFDCSVYSKCHIDQIKMIY